MKTIAKLLIFSALFASCERELLESVVSKDGVVVATKATGVSESAAGAGGIDPIYPVFKKGDQISVRLSTEGDHACVEYDGSKFCFSRLSKSKPHYAVFPYSCVNHWVKDSNGWGPVSITVPDKQVAIKDKLDSNAFIMYDKWFWDENATEIILNPAIAILKIPNYWNNVKSITISSGKIIAGSASLKYSSNEKVSISGGDKNTVTLVPATEGGNIGVGDYYVSIIPTKNNIITLTYNLEKNSYSSSLPSNDYCKGHVYDYSFGTITDASFNDLSLSKHESLNLYYKERNKSLVFQEKGGDKYTFKMSDERDCVVNGYDDFAIARGDGQVAVSFLKFSANETGISATLKTSSPYLAGGAVLSSTTLAGTGDSRTIIKIKCYKGDNYITLIPRFFVGMELQLGDNTTCLPVFKAEPGKIYDCSVAQREDTAIKYKDILGVKANIEEASVDTYVYNIGNEYPDDIINMELAKEYYSGKDKGIEFRGIYDWVGNLKEDDQNDAVSLYNYLFPKLYNVKVCGEEQYVYKTEEPHICTFGADGSVLVEIALANNKEIKKVVVRPEFKHNAYIKGKKAYVSLKPYDKVSVEITADGWSWDEKLKDEYGNYITASKIAVVHPLFIFVNPKQEETSEEFKAFYDNNENNEDNKTQFKTSNKSKKTFSDGEKSYLPGGCVFNGHIAIGDKNGKTISSQKNITLKGYGIIDARLKSSTDSYDGYSFALSVIGSTDINVDGLIVINKDLHSTYNLYSSDVKYNNYKVVAVFADRCSEVGRSYNNMNKNGNVDLNKIKHPGNENDGIDIFSCKNVTISDCFVYSHDDCYAIASQYDADLYHNCGIKKYDEEIKIENCIGMNVKGGNTFAIGGSKANIEDTEETTNLPDRGILLSNVYSIQAGIGHILPNPAEGNVLSAICVKNVDTVMVGTDVKGYGRFAKVSIENAFIEEAHQHTIGVVSKHKRSQMNGSFTNINVSSCSDSRGAFIYGISGNPGVSISSNLWGDIDYKNADKVNTKTDWNNRIVGKEGVNKMIIQNCEGESIKIGNEYYPK